jgi:hypothetical protein
LLRLCHGLPCVSSSRHLLLLALVWPGFHLLQVAPPWRLLLPWLPAVLQRAPPCVLLLWLQPVPWPLLLR